MGALPRITISYAQSLDGRIATLTGQSQWISSPQTLRLAHRLRRDNEVILAGIGTVLRDDPELTCRIGTGSRATTYDRPVRVILDSHLRLPLASKIASSAGRVPTIACTTDAASPKRKIELEAAGVRVVALGKDEHGLVPVRRVVEFLGEEGYRSLFVEGGGKVITSFLKAGLVHRMIIVIAPLLIGEGVAAVGDLGVRSLEEALRPVRSRTRRLGADIVVELDFGGP